MNFEKDVPQWTAAGTEPPASLKSGGFTAGYKPPAAYFNWFWSGVSACLTEIRSKLSAHKHAAGDIESGTLSVQRGGTGRGTVTAGSYLVGNGTGAMTEKTPAQVLEGIGAAAASHTHAQSDVTGLSSALSGINTGISSINTALDAKAAKSHTHAIADVTSLQAALDGKANASHTQSASTINSGTLAGKVLANASSAATLTDKQVRNIVIATAEPSSAGNGDIWLSYSN